VLGYPPLLSLDGSLEVISGQTPDLYRNIAMMKQFMHLVISCLLLGSCASAQREEAPPFQVFWNNFRIAVINDDKHIISSFTKFPFEVKEPSDTTPIKYYDRAKFLKIIDPLLDQSFYLLSGKDVITNSMRKVIINKQKIVKSNLLGENIARIEQFTFIRSEGKWLFDRAYVEDIMLIHEFFK
jgi:hypothetical protein